MLRIAGMLRRNETLVILLALEATIHMAWTSIVPVLPRFARSFEAGAFQVGLLISLFGVGRMLANLPAGYLSERWGRRTLLIWGATLVTTASFLSGIATSFWELALYRFLTGVGGGIFTTMGLTVLADITLPQSRGRIMALYEASIYLGGGFGPVPGGFIGEHFGFRASFFFAASIAALFTLWGVLRLRETKGTLAMLDARAEKQNNFRRRLRSLALPLSDGSFFLVCLLGFAIVFGRTGARQAILPLLAYDWLGLTESQLGSILGGISLVDFSVLYLSGILVDRLGRKAVIVPSNLLASLSLALFALSHSILFFLVAAVVMALGMGLGGPAVPVYVADVAPPAARGVSMAIYRTFGDLAYFLGPMLLGWISDLSHYGWALSFNALLGFAITLLFWALARETLSRERRGLVAERR